MAKGKLDLFSIGQGGVNVVKNPIVLDRDEALLLQNVIYPSLNGEGGLQKRGGLAKKNATAMNSGASILALADVQLPNPFNTSTLPRQYLYLGIADNSSWIYTADGITWLQTNDFYYPGLFRQNGIPSLGLATIQPVTGKLLYIDPNHSLDNFLIWDGTAGAPAQDVLTVPPIVSTAAYSAGASGYHLGDFYFGTNDPPFGRVYKLDLTTGQLTMIGGGQIGTQYTCFSIISYLGLLFIGASDNNGGGSVTSFIYKCDPVNATAWTVDSAALTGVPTAMVNFLGDLYICTGSRQAADPMRIYKRTPSGTYSTVYTDANPWNVTSGGAMIVFNNALFAYIAGNILTSTDGTVWTVDKDVYTTYGFDARTGLPVIFNGELYWPFYDGTANVNGRVLKRTTGGVWSVSYGPAYIDVGMTIFEVP